MHLDQISHFSYSGTSLEEHALKVMKCALLQLNFTVGDLEGNARKIICAVKQAEKKGAQFCITSELAIFGYPPHDLLFNNTFIKKGWEVLERIADKLKYAPSVLMGIAIPNKNSAGKPLYNTAIVLKNGRITDKFYKNLLPTYDVFDEDRYFEPAKTINIHTVQNKRLGITICEDIWNDKNFWVKQRYHTDPIKKLATKKVNAIINISGSPFSVGKQALREKMLGAIAKQYRIPVLYVNQVGGNDDLIFDGRSSVFDNAGNLCARGASFKEDIVLVDLTRLQKGSIAKDDFTFESEIWNALVLGTKDYVQKCGFKKTLIGISGGIDSAVTTAIAVEALGKKNVLGVLMPSPYSSKGSIEDALQLARNLGIKTLTLPIDEAMRTFTKILNKSFAGYKTDTTEENIQARIRGNLLMAISNKYKAMLLTTGNKSELAVGYCTLYGDMSGGLAVISDVPKTTIYRLTEWLNAKKSLIPQTIIDKAPSAELKPNQTDQDSLPPYELLDQILEKHIEQHQSAHDIITQGFDKNIVCKVISLVKKAEFKRKQAPPGIKITDRAFGTGWRMPIAYKNLWNM